MPDAVVLDASAILDAAGEGPRFERLGALLAERDARAPALVLWELGQFAHGRNARRFGATPKARSQAVELLLQGIAIDLPDAEARARTGEVAARHALTYYDAAYLELAMRDEDAVLVTHDAHLLAAARRVLGRERAFTLDE